MIHILSEFFAFLASVFAHWEIWLSGGGFGGFIVVGVGVFEKFSEKSLSKRTYFYIFLVSFFVCSCFISWVGKDTALKAAERQAKTNTEKLNTKITEANNAYAS